MADPINEIQAIGATRRSPILAVPAEAPNAGAVSGLTREEAPRRVAPPEQGGETQDAMAMTALRDKMKRLMTQLAPIRVSFLVDRESQNVRIRVIDVATGEIIREVPPGDVLKSELPAERP